MALLTRILQMKWRLLVSIRRVWFNKADVLIGASGFSFSTDDGRLYSPLFDSAREVFERAGRSVQMVSLHGDDGVRNDVRCEFEAGSVPTLPAVERGRFADALVFFLSGGRRRTRFEERAWKRILDVVEPQVVVANQPSRALCRAGRRHGIEVHDLQHGIILENHSGYYNLTNPVRTERDEWPSSILCWDDRSAAIVNRVLGEHTSGKVVGHPWLSRFIETHPNDGVISAAVARANVVSAASRLPIVLVTLSWQRGDRSGLRGELLPDPLLRYLAQKTSIAWLVRPHQVQVMESRGKIHGRIADCLRDVKTALDARALDDLALPAALSVSAAHVTVNSSSALEAIGLGVPSWRFSAPHPLYENSLVTSGTNIDALDNWLNQCLEGRPSPSVSGVSERPASHVDFAERLLRCCGCAA